MTAPPDLADPHRLVLIRHGQTSHTAARRISGAGYRPEPGLDDMGREQASAAAQRLLRSGVAVDDFVVSPLLRAQQTAAVIGERLGLPGASLEADWSEAHFGSWEGLTAAEVSARQPGAWQAMIGDPAVPPPGGESLLQVRARVLARWRASAVPGRTSLVVTHLTPIRIVLADTLGVPDEKFMQLLAAPGSITIVDSWSDGGAAVITMGERPITGE